MSNFIISNAELEMIRNQSVALVVLPVVEEDGILLGVSWIYFCLFLIGFCGNLGVLFAVFQMRGILFSTDDNTAIFVIFLSLMDLCVIAALPLVITKMLIG